MFAKHESIILHAPGIHQGGGLRLLAEILEKSNNTFVALQLDARCTLTLPESLATKVHYIPNTLMGRLKAEWRLRSMSNASNHLLCFHSLPPLFPVSGEVAIYLQNRLLIESDHWKAFSWRARLRLLIQSVWLRVCTRQRYHFFVQTPSMKKALQNFLGQQHQVDVDTVLTKNLASQSSMAQKKYDFLYVADDQPHKNHKALLLAWQHLAEKELYPSLALTVDRDTELAKEISVLARQYDLNITLLGVCPLSEMPERYDSASALIYPSLTESLGLPLLEAQEQRLPILASELPFVHDVVKPAYTFDPNSSAAIAQAVQAFLTDQQATQGEV